jgi:hypothetical protein
MSSSQTNGDPPDTTLITKSLSKQADELDKLMHEKSHVLHTGLFVVSAVFTIAYWITSPGKVPGVEMTHFKMLDITDIAPKKAVTTKSELLQKWKCTGNNTNATALATVEPWGPDSMCRCIDSLMCSGESCETNETNCYTTHVPSYAYVYGGYIDCFWNIIVAFFLLHIAVMLNMFIETREDEIEEENRGNIDTVSGEVGIISEPGQKFVGPYPSPFPNDATEATSNTTRTDFSRKQNGNGGSGKHHAKGRVVTFNESDVNDNTRVPKGVRYGSAAKLGYMFLQGSGANELHDLSSEETSMLLSVRQKPWGEKSSSERVVHSIQMKEFRLFVIFALSVIVLGCSSESLNSRTKLRETTGQTCDGVTCMTEMLLTIVTLALSSVNILWVGWFAYCIFQVNDSWKVSTYKLTILEFIHTAVAFMLLVSSFSAMSGVHDDTTNHFDVLVVLFVMFLQGVQHIIMMQRETIISYCSEKGVVLYDEFMTKYTVENTILSYFLYTRLFVFLVIIGAVFVFIDRIEPSIAPGGFIASSNYYLRIGTLLLSLTPGVIADINYELSHVAEMRTTGNYRPYVGAHAWRRGVFLCAMIAYIIFSFKTEKVSLA